MGASFTHILKIYGRLEAGTTHKHPKKKKNNYLKILTYYQSVINQNIFNL